MPITTWLTEQELTPCTDTDLAPLLADVFLATGERWVALPYIPQRWRDWWRDFWRIWHEAGYKKPEMLYSLCKILDSPAFPLMGQEAQILNFYRADSGTSINTIVPKELLMAYLFGLLGGVQQQQGERRRVHGED